MRFFLPVGLCSIVAGCSSGTAERLAYQESADERMTRIASAGPQECEAKFPRASGHNHLAQAHCEVKFKSGCLPQADYPDRQAPACGPMLALRSCPDLQEHVPKVIPFSRAEESRWSRNLFQIVI